MNLIERHEKLGDTPALIVFGDNIEKAGAQGTILFYHGLTAKKETNLKELRSLAALGFLAVGIDNVGHGERKYPDFDERSKAGKFFEEFFLEMVKDTADEVPSVIEALIRRGYSNPDNFGICGISMGGYITYAGLLNDKRLKAGVSILGSPKWTSGHPGSPHLNPDKFFPKAVLSQNAGKDAHVPAQLAKEFHQELKKYYAGMPERERYLLFPDSDHFMLEDDWNSLWDNTTAWFKKFLN